jgi:hypothetical protein
MHQAIRSGGRVLDVARGRLLGGASRVGLPKSVNQFASALSHFRNRGRD